MRKKDLLAGQVLLLLLVAGTLYFKGHHLTSLPLPIPLRGSRLDDRPDSRPDSRPDDRLDDAAIPLSGVISAENITRYVDAINDPHSSDLPRLQCPDIPSPSRYDGLKPAASSGGATALYFFAIDLRETVTLLPRLLGSVVEAMRFLGAENCALSVVEGNSHDGTYDVLQALRPRLAALGVAYHLRSSDINPLEGDRIAKLAELRNLALAPLVDGRAWGAADDANDANDADVADDTTVVFLNDVAACTEDILELVYQRRRLGADMVCGFDWVYVGRDPTFYDVWIARGLNGDAFFDIPPDGNWNSAWNLFWNDDGARASMAAHTPFQVFSCWNGAAVFAARPLVDKHRPVAFRAPRDGECKQGEPQLFCKDLWFHGYNKIAVVPAVNLEYSDENARKIKDLKGYTSRWVSTSDDEAGIAWQDKPPDTVRCIPSYDAQSFRPWNETLP